MTGPRFDLQILDNRYWSAIIVACGKQDPILVRAKPRSIHTKIVFAGTGGMIIGSTKLQ